MSIPPYTVRAWHNMGAKNPQNEQLLTKQQNFTPNPKGIHAVHSVCPIGLAKGHQTQPQAPKKQSHGARQYILLRCVPSQCLMPSSPTSCGGALGSLPDLHILGGHCPALSLTNSEALMF